MAVGDLLSVQVVGASATQVAINTVHYQVVAEAGAGVPVGIIATQMDTLLHAAYKALMSAQATYRGVMVTKIWPLPRSVRGEENQNAAIGQVAGDGLPWQVSGVLSFSTAFGGAKYRGRVYIPFPGEADNDNTQAPIAGYVTRLTTLLNLWLASQVINNGGNSVTITPGIYHRGDHTFTPFNTGLAKQLWATQRRRGNYGRENAPPI